MKIIHFIKYHFNKEYRQKYDSKVKFMKIMAANKSILRGSRV